MGDAESTLAYSAVAAQTGESKARLVGSASSAEAKTSAVGSRPRTEKGESQRAGEAGGVDSQAQDFRRAAGLAGGVSDQETTGVAGGAYSRGMAAEEHEKVHDERRAGDSGAGLGGSRGAVLDRFMAVMEKGLSVRLLLARSAAQQQEWRTAVAMVLPPPPSRIASMAAQALDGRELAELFMQPVADLTVEVHQVIGGWQGVMTVDGMVIAGTVDSGSSVGAEMEALRTAYFCILPQVKKGIQTLSPVTRRFEQNVQQGT